jgi:hypothetical protein
MIHTTGFMQVVPNSFKPAEVDVKKLAYFYWLTMGKPEGKDLEHYYKCELALTKAGNSLHFNYGAYITYLRGL